MGERRPAAEHVVDRLGQIVVAREPGELGVQPGMEIGHQRRAVLLARGEACGGALAIDGTLDVEQRIEASHGLKRDRIDLPGPFATAFLAGSPFDVGKLEELAPRVREAASFENRPRLAPLTIELVVTAIGISLQDARPGREMRPGMRSEWGPKRSRLSLAICSLRCAIRAWSAEALARALASSASASVARRAVEITSALSAATSSGRFETAASMAEMNQHPAPGATGKCGSVYENQHPIRRSPGATNTAGCASRSRRAGRPVEHCSATPRHPSLRAR